VVAIDHLPTLLPLESSQHFARDLLPTIKVSEQYQGKKKKRKHRRKR
jgi:hypothetical protein